MTSEGASILNCTSRIHDQMAVSGCGCELCPQVKNFCTKVFNLGAKQKFLKHIHPFTARFDLISAPRIKRIIALSRQGHAKDDLSYACTLIFSPNHLTWSRTKRQFHTPRYWLCFCNHPSKTLSSVAKIILLESETAMIKACICIKNFDFALRLRTFVQKFLT